MNASDAPNVQILRHATVTGRVAHTCSGCGANISKGTTHEVVVLLMDGALKQYRRCARCR
jgi:predicted  nucleic acid-binding Zn-ribbon protein